MTVAEEIESFTRQYGKELVVNNRAWHYYRVGTGQPILWLTGGLRRAALGFAFLDRLAARHTVIAPDYPPVRTVDEFIVAIDAILQAEGVGACVLAGQSYGGMLAQAYLAHRSHKVERLILSSTGPANYRRAWLPVEYGILAMLRVLPEKALKNLLRRTLVPLISLPEQSRLEWTDAINNTIQSDLSRADVLSHIAVTADLIRKRTVTPAAYRNWTGRVIVLRAENDPTQSEKDFPQYEQLFGRSVEVIDMGDMGHTALLFNPDKCVELLEPALE